MSRAFTRTHIPIHLYIWYMHIFHTHTRTRSINVFIPAFAVEAQYQDALRSKADSARDFERERSILQLSYGRHVFCVLMPTQGRASHGTDARVCCTYRIAIFGGINAGNDDVANGRGYCSAVAVALLYCPPPPLFGEPERASVRLFALPPMLLGMLQLAIMTRNNDPHRAVSAASWRATEGGGCKHVGARRCDSRGQWANISFVSGAFVAVLLLLRAL